MNNLSYYLALNRINKVGPRTVLKLLKRWPNLKEMFELSEQALVNSGLPLWIAKAISEFDKKLIEEDMSWEQSSANHHLVTWDSPLYPKLLKEISDPPVVLYAKGQLNVLDSIQLAVVGSRNPTITGIENARNFSRALAGYGVTIVSGLALGVDAEAHMGCLEAKGKTIAVLGTGINCIYPRRHLKLANEITENGLILSEFPLNSPPIAGHFPRRNRIISGLSLCTLVIEAAIHSGSLITARMALEQNRDVLAIPGSIHNPLARGCHHLLQQGAKLVTSVADILDELQISPHSVDTKEPKVPFANEDENLVRFIGYETTSIDDIMQRSGYCVEQVTCELAELEIIGAIQSVPGGYMRCKNERPYV